MLSKKSFATLCLIICSSTFYARHDESMTARGIATDAEAVVLAAGKSSRMKTGRSKQLSPICGQAMLLYPLRALDDLGIKTTVVLGTQAEDIVEKIQKAHLSNCWHIIQKEQKGTGHAVACGKKIWEKDHVIVINGDCPMLKAEDIRRLYERHMQEKAAVTFLATIVEDTPPFGRVVEENGTVAIVEHKDCTEEQRAITKVNVGVYIFEREFLVSVIEELAPSPVTGEYYVTDVITHASLRGRKVSYDYVPYDNIRGVNTQEDLWNVTQLMQQEIISRWMSRGVCFEQPTSTHIDNDVAIGAGTVIGPNVVLSGKTSIGNNSIIGPFVVLRDSTLGNNVTIESHVVIDGAPVGNDVIIPPFSYIHI